MKIKILEVDLFEINAENEAERAILKSLELWTPTKASQEYSTDGLSHKMIIKFKMFK